MRIRPIVSSVSAVLFASLCVLAQALPTYAQVQTGTPPFGSFSGGPDVINNGNLNVHYAIPVVSKAGRGLPFNFLLTYDSSVWYPVTAGSAKSWQPVAGWGWNQSESNIGSVTYQTSVFRHLYPCGDFYAFTTITTYSDWTYHDGFHTSHTFPVTTSTTDDGCAGTITTTSDQGTTTDGSGYTLAAHGNTVTLLTNVKGTQISPNTGAGSAVDRNGNEISLGSNGTITDTLGTIALTMSGSGTPTSPAVYSYTAPSGAQANYTVNYTAYTVATNFGVSGITEYGAHAVNLVSSIVLPDGSQYAFTYEPTPSTPASGACTPLANTYSGNCVTARIASVTLPTGGEIKYSYSGGSNGILSDGTTATLTRTTPDGTWQYVHTEGGSAWTTTITDPQNNQTTMNFQGIYETERQIYQGASTLLKTIYTCYNGASAPCNSTAVTLPITQCAVTVRWPTGLESQTVTSYNLYGLPTETDEHGYGSGSPGTLARKTVTAYASLGNNIVDEPSSVTIEDGSGNTIAQTKYTYDGSSVTTTGATQLASVSGSRGNATTVQSWVSGSNYLTRHYTYLDTGTVNTFTDVNNAQYTYAYPDSASTCDYAFPTKVTEPIGGMTKQMTWNCTGGVQLTATDENGQLTSTDYADPYYWRPASIKDPTSAVTGYYYQPNPSHPEPYEVMSSVNFNNGASVVSSVEYMDGLGRPLDRQKLESPTSGTLDTISYSYDPEGRLSTVAGPCVTGYVGTCSTPARTTTYDTLGRPTKVTDTGGLEIDYTYSANDVLETVGPAPSGETTKKKQYEYDALGRLISVCEITTLPGNGPCGQNTPATGYFTQYTYDALGDLATVTQGAQTRTYNYDGLGRMTSESNPETGTVIYAYDSATGTDCASSSPGNLIKQTDAAGNWTCYDYDALHRVTDVGNSNQSATNACKRFRYDDSQGVMGHRPTGVTINNGMARVVEASTDDCSTYTPITDEWFSYDARGETSDLYESTPHSGGYYHTVATYWANGAPNEVYVPGGYWTARGLDGEGRTYSISTQQQSATYNAAGEPTQVVFGSGDSDSFSYDPNTDRMTQYKFNVGSQSVIGNLTWNPNGTLQELAITDPFNSANSQNCNYTHDDLSRLAGVTCTGSGFSGTYSYDAFGNLKKSGTDTFQPSYNSATNQMTAIGSQTPTYDSDGNVLNDYLNSYSWDAYGRPTTIDSVSITYDAFGRVVEQNRGGTYTEMEYSPTGYKVESKNGSTRVASWVPLTGGAVAVYNATGFIYYQHGDWLGSGRFASTYGRTMYYDQAVGPFGEPYAQAGTAVPDFTGMNQDTAPNVYDFPMREYGIQGRWPSPDPAGLAAVDPSDPQTWNRYAYVRNSPLSSTDPTGTSRAPLLAPAILGLESMEQCGAAEIYCVAFAGGGGVAFGCDEFDFINPNSYCSTTVMPILNGTYSPYQYQYTGPASGGQTVTFNSWDQYASWRTSVAAGAQDPCVFSQFSNGSYTGTYTTNTTMNQQGCANFPSSPEYKLGGQWVPPGFSFEVDSNTGKVSHAHFSDSTCGSLDWGGGYLAAFGTNPWLLLNPDTDVPLLLLALSGWFPGVWGSLADANVDWEDQDLIGGKMGNLGRLLPNPGLLGKQFYAGPAFKSYFFVLDSVLLLLAVLMNVLILARYWTALSSFAQFWLVVNGLAMISFWFLALRFRGRMRELHAKRDAVDSGPEVTPEAALRIAASVMHLGLFYGFGLLIGLLNLLADILHKQIYRPG